MHRALRYALEALFVTVMVPAAYLASCLMGERYDRLQLWLYAAFGLVAGLGFAVRSWWRGRTGSARGRAGRS